ncbi:MAG: molybdopterin-dependent oxidoreductase [Promethearchaeota archaeon]
MTERIIETVCPRDCYDTCFLKVLIDDEGKIVSVKGDPKNPVTGRLTCPRAAKDSERLYLNRVLYPHLRQRENFKEIDWKNALQLITEKLRTVLEDYGSEAILHLEYAGNTGLLTWSYPLRVWNALGATQTDNAICSNSGHEALSLHYGLSYGIQPEELLKQRLIIFWGFNASVSSIHLWKLAQKARDHGTLVAVIDPRNSKSAQKADIWLNPYPGSDVALVYGVMRYIIEQEYVDLNFIEKYTYGYEKLKTEVMKWTPNRVEEVTGINQNGVEEIGNLIGNLKPSVTMIGIGFQKSVQGAESVRAVALLPALIGLHRSFYYSNGNGYSVDFPYLTGEKFLQKRIKTVSQVALSDFVKRGDFKFIYIYNMNPVLTLPNQKALREGLSSNDTFVVVHETHWTESCEYANVVLPAPTYLEKNDLVIPWSHRYVRLSKKVVDPIAKSRDEIWVMRELAKKLAITEKWVYEDPWEAVRKALKKSFKNGTFEDLLNGKIVELECRHPNHYQTPTKKIEFYSKKAEGLDSFPLPVYHPLNISKKEFIMLNSSLLKYTHTQFREVYGPIPAIVWINPKDSYALGIKNGDLIRLYNKQGSILVKTEISENIPLGVLWSPKLLIGLSNKSQNILTPCTTQRIGKGPIFNSTIVRISKQ